MRKVSVVALLLLFCGVYAFAGSAFPSGSSDAPKGEFFAGYSYLHVDTGGAGESSVPTGFNLDGTYYFAGPIGVTADFQYHHKSFGASSTSGLDSARVFSFHGGPRVKLRSGPLEPFAHALFGVTDLGVTPIGGSNTSDHAFSMKLGGGVDVGAGRHFALRLGEFNYYYTKFSTVSGFSLNGQDHQNNFTFSAGIVIR